MSANDILAWERLSTIIPLTIWISVTLYWAVKQDRTDTSTWIYRWGVVSTLTFLTLVSIEVWRIRILEDDELVTDWFLIANTFLTLSIWVSTAAAIWPFVCRLFDWCRPKT